ncbi:DUF6625 family protein [Oenococcus sp.]|uniref:DUF6625 family protein n=1 Tax=Oenococcus sp. TaxID=1979414 RepID=UPI0039E774A0
MKIGLINVYFGEFPNYFPIFLLSAAKNSNFDFLIFSDVEVDYDLPQNVKVIKTTFSQLKKRIQAILPFRIDLRVPYKLSDFKPIYGDLFSRELIGYTHWGYFDLDIVLGNLSNTISIKDLSNFDRIGDRGHLSIFKNTSSIVKSYLSDSGHLGFSCKEAFSSPRIFHFDEMWGINTFFNNLHTSKPLKNDLTPGALFDTSVKRYPLVQATHPKSTHFFIFEWQNGTLTGYAQDQKIEFSYLHLQKRKMSILNLKKQVGQTDLSHLTDFCIDQNHFFVKPDLQGMAFIRAQLDRQKMHWPEGDFSRLFKYYKNTVISGEQLSRCQLILKRKF